MADNPYSGSRKRRIKAARVTHVSLTKRGKNKMPVMMKGEGVGEGVPFQLHTTLTKMDKEGLLTAIVWPANRPDSVGDWATPETVQQMAHDFLGYGGRLDMDHDLNPLTPQQVQLCESFIVAKGDARFENWKDYEGQPVGELAGSWAQVYRIHDPAIKQLFESGGWNGVSLFGPCVVETAAKSDTTTNLDSEINDMDSKELKDAIVTGVTEALKAALAAKSEPTPAPAAPAKPEPIKFQGDPLNVDDIAKHEERLFIATLDLSKAEDVAKLRERAEAKAKAGQKKDEKPGSELELAKAELEAAKERLKKAEGASGQPTSEKKSDDESDAQRQARLGKERAERLNQQRGFAAKK